MKAMTKTMLRFLPGLLLLAGCAHPSSGQTKVTRLAVDEFEQKLQTISDHQLIDVCTLDEFRQRHIDGAVNVDFYRKDFKDAVGFYDKNKPTFVYCYAGSRSADAVAIMEKLGFREVYELKGGISSWMKAGKPVVQQSVPVGSGISEAAYKTTLDSAEKVLVVFSTTWCPPCRKLKPVLDELEPGLSGQVKIARLDGDLNKEQGNRVGVEGFPTLILYKQGKEVWRHTGFMEKDELSKTLSTY